MSKQTFINMPVKEYFELLVGLIADDLKIHKHLHFLTLGGLDSTPLKLSIHERVFNLLGFSNDEVTEEMEEWYFSQAERVYSLDIIHDSKMLLNLSVEILDGLNKFKSQNNRKKFPE